MSSCVVDNDCSYNFTCHANVCTHKTLADPTATQILGYILNPILLGMINLGGQGGGINQFPILVLLFHYSMKDANTLQYLPIIGTSFANAFYLVPQRHPENPDRSLVDYDFIITVFPNLVLGTSIGIFINLISPDIVVTLGMLIALFYSTYKVKDKAQQYLAQKKKMQEEEQKQRNQKSIESPSQKVLESQNIPHFNPVNITDTTQRGQTHLNNYNASPQKQKQDDQIKNQLQYIVNAQPPLDNSFSSVSSPSGQQHLELKDLKINFLEDDQSSPAEPNLNHGGVIKLQGVQQDANKNDLGHESAQEAQKRYEEEKMEYEAIMADNRRYIPIRKVIFIIVFYFIFYINELFIGSKKVPSVLGLAVCSGAYWVLTFYRIIFVQVCNYLVYSMQMRNYAILRKFGNPAQNEMSQNTILEVMTIAFIAGFMVGMIGVGGGLLFIPWLVGNGFHPTVSSASSAFNYVIISITSLLQILIGKLVDSEKMTVFILESFFGSLIFTGIYTWIAKKYKIDYFGLLFSAILFVMVIICIFIYMGVEYPQMSNDQIMKGGSICP